MFEPLRVDPGDQRIERKLLRAAASSSADQKIGSRARSSVS
jgi:hypothetical protein